MLDHPSQIAALTTFAAANPSTPRWDAFVKIDMGTHRAGIPATSPTLHALIAAAQAAPTAVRIHGFYCHAGHSYASRSPTAAASVLHDEVNAAAEAAALIQAGEDEALTVSFGSTPTAHVVAQLRHALPARLRLELHAGNFPANDLQQLGTGCVREEDQAVRVLAEVCSLYEGGRNEALVNAGVVALAREPGPLEGFGRVVGRGGRWCVGRLSQEHGILVTSGGERVEEVFAVGEKVWLWVQHACITAAAHHYYFVVDEADVVREVWFPWKGW